MAAINVPKIKGIGAMAAEMEKGRQSAQAGKFAGFKASATNTNEFVPKDAPIKIGGGADRLSGAFSRARDMAGNRSNAALQDQTNALQRRFSAMGAAGSGAQIKAIEQATEANNQQKLDAQSNIDIQEAQALQNQDMAQADLDFKQRVSNYEIGSKLHELNLAERQQRIDYETGKFNEGIAQQMAKPPEGGIITKVLGGIL